MKLAIFFWRFFDEVGAWLQKERQSIGSNLHLSRRFLHLGRRKYRLGILIKGNGRKSSDKPALWFWILWSKIFLHTFALPSPILFSKIGGKIHRKHSLLPFHGFF